MNINNCDIKEKPLIKILKSLQKQFCNISNLGISNIFKSQLYTSNIMPDLTDYLKCSKELTFIDISKNKISPELGKIFFEGIRECENLKHLNYSYNYIR